MKPIKFVEYIELDVRTKEIECHVVYCDETNEVFSDDEDLDRVRRQLQKQWKPGTRITL